jgi:hypothetical protein
MALKDVERRKQLATRTLTNAKPDDIRRALTSTRSDIMRAIAEKKRQLREAEEAKLRAAMQLEVEATTLSGTTADKVEGSLHEAERNEAELLREIKDLDQKRQVYEREIQTWEGFTKRGQSTSDMLDFARQMRSIPL